MIPGIIYLLVGTFIQAVALFFMSLNLFPPVSSLFSAISYFLSNTAYFYGVIDLPRLYTDAGIALGFEVFWFIFLIGWYVVGFIRAIFTRGSSH
jgi:hypothetical protein